MAGQSDWEAPVPEGRFPLTVKTSDYIFQIVQPCIHCIDINCLQRFNAYLDAWLLALTAVVHLAGEGAIVYTVLHWAGRGRLIFCCMLEVKKQSAEEFEQ